MIPLSDAAFFRRTLIVLAVIAVGVLAWRLVRVELLLFGSILVAVVLRRLSHLAVRYTPLGPKLALSVTIVGLVLLLALMGAFFGWRIQAQVTEATELLPKAFRVFMDGLRQSPFGGQLIEEMHKLHVEQAMPALSRLPSFAVSAMVGLGEFLAVLVGGIYLAAQPELYRGGLLGLLPARARHWTAGTLDEAGEALHQWLLGQLVAMVAVGVLSGLGLWIIGVPAATALGLFAGLAEFVPVAGPIISAIPAILLALLHGVDKAAWTLLLFCAVQQFEGHVILPVVQRRFATLPPVVTVFAVLGFALVLGPLGVLLGVPLTVVGMVVLRRARRAEEAGAAGADQTPA